MNNLAYTISGDKYLYESQFCNINWIQIHLRRNNKKKLTTKKNNKTKNEKLQND